MLGGSLTTHNSPLTTHHSQRTLVMDYQIKPKSRRGAVSFWTGHVLADTDKLKPRFDDDLLEDCFQRLAGQTEPGRVNFRYVVALLLMRRRRFRFENSVMEDGIEKMILRCM